MLDASFGGAFLSKSHEEGYKLIERIRANTYQWPVIRVDVVAVVPQILFVFLFITFKKKNLLKE